MSGQALPRLGILISGRGSNLQRFIDACAGGVMRPGESFEENALREVAEEIEMHESTVRRVAGLVLHSEYKRRQGAPGVRLTSRAFGRDRRYPLTSGF